MKISISCTLCVFAFVASWLGAIASRSPVAIELISTASFVAIISTLGLAIFDSNDDRRPFWTGFFICGIGFMFATFFTSMQESNNAITAFICNLGDQQPQFNSATPQLLAASPTFVNPAGPATSLTPSFYPGVPKSYAYRQSISQAVPVLSAIVAALAGGVATIILSKRKLPPGGDAG